VPGRAADQFSGIPAVTIASLPFLGFVAVVALLYALAPGLWWRQALMLVANLTFLSTFAASPVMFVPLLGFLAVSYGGFWLITATRSGRLHGAVIVCIIVMFFWLKRYSFLPQETWLPFTYTTIGLSYIFFRNLHLLIDAHEQAGEPAEYGVVGPIAFLNYTLNFTSLVSGPIQLFEDYARDQLRITRPPLDWTDAGIAVERIAIGFFKVVVLSAILNSVHHESLAALSGSSGLSDRVYQAMLTSVGYTLYLYCNFSGYTDIVIGAARFYGLRLPENFNYPFSATSFIEFWSRWHMTLSGWLRRYVYNPLVMTLMRRYPSRRWVASQNIGAIFVTFFLIGLWHGQTSVFVCFGVLQGLGVSGNRIYQLAMAAKLGNRRYAALTESAWYRMLSRGLTFTYFTLTLFFFWGSWPDIGMTVRTLGIAGCLAFVVALVGCSSLVLALVEAVRIRASGHTFLTSRYTRTIWVTVLGTMAVAALVLLSTPAPDIVYKTF
jgi:alginate O-acetyltransferase complex protein AlgI